MSYRIDGVPVLREIERPTRYRVDGVWAVRIRGDGPCRRVDGVRAGRRRRGAREGERSASTHKAPRSRTQVSQYLYHDCLEALPESADRPPKDDKNDSVRVVFGQDMVSKLAN